MTSTPLREVLQIPALEYNQWVRHFDRYPFGDYHSQKILASMWFLIASYLGTKITTKGGPEAVSSPNDIAPWLESSDELRERIAAEAKSKAEKSNSEQAGYAATVASAYKARKRPLDG